jgi:hypothetical protein
LRNTEIPSEVVVAFDGGAVGGLNVGGHPIARQQRTVQRRRGDNDALVFGINRGIARRGWRRAIRRDLRGVLSTRRQRPQEADANDDAEERPTHAVKSSQRVRSVKAQTTRAH